MNREEAVITKLGNQEVRVMIMTGSGKGNEYTVQLFDERQIAKQDLRQGDRVVVSVVQTQGKKTVLIEDHVRTWPILWLFLLFLIIVAVVGRSKGIMSFFAMICTFFIIARFILPQIMLGNDPILISLIGSAIIIPVIFYISHGIHRKTTIAVFSTFITLIITGLLGAFWVQFVRLTGYASEEANFFQVFGIRDINMQSLLLSGIIIGALGVLDDITISQTAIVEKLARANPKYTARHLFQEAMDVGRDHIASLVNPLILVYTSVSLPLLIVFSQARFTYAQIVSMEAIATEIVRTIISSIGIILAVPITTAIAVWYRRK